MKRKQEKNKQTNAKKENKYFNIENNMLKKNTKSNGITLIALIITIIVLLILSGITIATLTGENGIIKKANDAKDKTHLAAVTEYVRTDIMGIQTKNGRKITQEELIKILEKYFDEVPNPLPQDLSGLKLKTKSQYGNQQIEIAEIYNGGLIATADNITVSNYGEYVNYGIDIDGDGKTNDDWRIFYAKDYKGEGEGAKTTPEIGRRIFLISSDYVKITSNALQTAMKNTNMIQSINSSEYCIKWDENNLPNYKCILPKEGENACAFPELFEFTKYNIKENISNINSKCVASLLCTENWKSFVAYGAECAIGSPTIEMWINSWNDMYPEDKLYTGINNDGYRVGTQENSLSGNVGGKGVMSQKNGYNNRLYYPHRSDDTINKVANVNVSWLASPSSVTTRDNLDSISHSGQIGDNYYSYYGGEEKENRRSRAAIRPIICLKSDVQLIDNGEKVNDVTCYDIR